MSAKDIERLASAALLVPRSEPMTYDHATKIVRAILQALREPSEEMVRAAPWCFGETRPEEVWQAMIDHLLSE